MTLQELFSADGTWTQGADARASDGEDVPHFSDRACCWCLDGGLRKCYKFAERPLVLKKLWEAGGHGIGWRVYDPADGFTCVDLEITDPITAVMAAKERA